MYDNSNINNGMNENMGNGESCKPINLSIDDLDKLSQYYKSQPYFTSDTDSTRGFLYALYSLYPKQDNEHTYEITCEHEYAQTMLKNYGISFGDVVSAEEFNTSFEYKRNYVVVCNDVKSALKYYNENIPQGSAVHLVAVEKLFTDINDINEFKSELLKYEMFTQSSLLFNYSALSNSGETKKLILKEVDSYEETGIYLSYDITKDIIYLTDVLNNRKLSFLQLEKYLEELSERILYKEEEIQQTEGNEDKSVVVFCTINSPIYDSIILYLRYFYDIRGISGPNNHELFVNRYLSMLYNDYEMPAYDRFRFIKEYPRMCLTYNDKINIGNFFWLNLKINTSLNLVVAPLHELDNTFDINESELQNKKVDLQDIELVSLTEYFNYDYKDDLIQYGDRMLDRSVEFVARTELVNLSKIYRRMESKIKGKREPLSIFNTLVVTMNGVDYLAYVSNWEFHMKSGILPLYDKLDVVYNKKDGKSRTAQMPVMDVDKELLGQLMPLDLVDNMEDDVFLNRLEKGHNFLAGKLDEGTDISFDMYKYYTKAGFIIKNFLNLVCINELEIPPRYLYELGLHGANQIRMRGSLIYWLSMLKPENCGLFFNIFGSPHEMIVDSFLTLTELNAK